MLSVGDKVRDYEIIASIRSGGMAMLYLARRRGLGGFSRLVALKLIHPHLTDDSGVYRLFLQEARVAASVAHPNVVHVEDVGQVDGKYFIAMEYVHGVSLDELLTTLAKKRLRLSPKVCVWIAAQLAEALHAVHAATDENGTPLNIVHRDVSPQNVLIGHTGHIKLIDFGIAKSQLMSQHASRRGSVLGKLRYMAPEQLRMEAVTRRTDVYALGVMLWEMLAARNLLRCYRIDDERDWATREAPPPPGQHAAGISAALDHAVLKALACEPAARYEGALPLRTALLRAEPSAAQLDAPTFAALLHQVLGDELGRRRANWPREVNVQLASAGRDTERALSLEQLTVRLRNHDDLELASEPDAEAPTFDRGPVQATEEEDDDDPDEATVAQRRAGASAVSPEASIPTYGVPAADTHRPRARSAPWSWLSSRRGKLAGAAVLGLALGGIVSAYGASSTTEQPRLTQARPAGVLRVADSPRVSAADAATTVLHETRIAAAPHAEGTRAKPASAPPRPALTAPNTTKRPAHVRTPPRKKLKPRLVKGGRKAPKPR